MNTSPAPKTCLHGCGEPVKGMYRPGHDAKHVAWLLEEIRLGTNTPAEALKEMPTPNMHNKLVKALRNRGWVWNYEEYVWEAPNGQR